ncbi:hypothetical protein [Candidatus Neomicrothrix sp.]|uniref:hypothetical protein n=1 Tax=Candidatus Neomicrothrix sp. TaxID=2719034 RepID=UPI00259956DD|nr:hypothetical protein [Candidatus Microthrix sp.]HMS48704.1 hypothetical protein [Candidatus Microthrix sp.]
MVVAGASRTAFDDNRHGGQVHPLLAESTFMQRTAGEWEAIGTWATVLVALVAALVALRQVKTAKDIRREESWPYVAIYIESVASKPQFVDLVIRNFGQTVATAIEIVPDAPVLRAASDSGTETEEVEFPTSIVTLAPGQEWRTLWDYAPDRKRLKVPNRYSFFVSYQSSDGKSHAHTYEIDWSAYQGRRWVNVKTVDDVAKSLKEVQKILGKWTESIHGSISVYVRDGDRKDAQKREADAEWPKKLAEFKEQLRTWSAGELEIEEGDADADAADDAAD